MRERTKPRISATATAMPTAAETKFCTARPIACAMRFMALSPEYHCQLVLVTKEIAVLSASSRRHCFGEVPGSHPWTSSRIVSATMLTALNASAATA